MYIKEFDKWNKQKQKIENEIRQINIRAGEIRWYSCGVNIGSEIDGKGESFTRPCIVLHVVGRMSALVVPLSSKKKDWAGRKSIYISEEEHFLCIDQIKIVSQKRILGRVKKIPGETLLKIKSFVKDFYSF